MEHVEYLNIDVKKREAREEVERESRESREAREAVEREAREARAAAHTHVSERIHLQICRMANENVNFHIHGVRVARMHLLDVNLNNALKFDNIRFYENELANALHHEVLCKAVNIMTDVEINRNVAFYQATLMHARGKEFYSRLTVFHQYAIINLGFHEYMVGIRLDIAPLPANL